MGSTGDVGKDIEFLINLVVNGKVEELPASVCLMDYLEGLAIRTDYLAVGYNGEVIEKEEFANIELQDGDVLEIVRPVGGG